MAGKGEEFGQMAVVQPKATDVAHAVLGKGRAVELYLYINLKSEIGLSSGTMRALEDFDRAAKKSEKGIVVEAAVFKMLENAENECKAAIAARGSHISSERLESAAAKSVQDMVKIGFTNEEASYLVGKALIDVGLKEPLQKMLSFSGANVDLINAFMLKMRAISHAKEQREKSDRDLKNVLAEHNVTEHKYEAA